MHTHIIILILRRRRESMSCTSIVSCESNNWLGNILAISVLFKNSVCSFTTNGCLTDCIGSRVSDFNEFECVCKTSLDFYVRNGNTGKCGCQTGIRDCDSKANFFSVSDSSASVVRRINKLKSVSISVRCRARFNSDSVVTSISDRSISWDFPCEGFGESVSTSWLLNETWTGKVNIKRWCCKDKLLCRYWCCRRIDASDYTDTQIYSDSVENNWSVFKFSAVRHFHRVNTDLTVICGVNS